MNKNNYVIKKQTKQRSICHFQIQIRLTKLNDPHIFKLEEI